MLKITDLKAELDRLGISPSRYSLDGGLPDCQYTIARHGLTWYVYYSERGNVTWQRLCPTEEEACEVLVQALLQNQHLYSK